MGNRVADGRAYCWDSSNSGLRPAPVINKAHRRWATEIERAKKPKTVEVTVTQGQKVGKTLLGIHQFKGGARKVCLAQPGSGRPTEFSPTAGGGHVLAALKRLKK